MSGTSVTILRRSRRPGGASVLPGGAGLSAVAHLSHLTDLAGHRIHCFAWEARYAWMTLTAIGADAWAPRPPPLTMTPIAICGLGLLAGAKPVNTASSRPELLMPFCAVPVFPAISMFGRNATAWAVPCGDCTTLIIMRLTSDATDGVTVGFRGAGL